MHALRVTSFLRLGAVAALLASVVLGLASSSASASSLAVELHSAYNGRCLDADLNTMWRNGTVMQLWDCNQEYQQSWYFNTPTTSLFLPYSGYGYPRYAVYGDIRSKRSGRCLDADLNTIGRNGAVVQLWDCNGQRQQQWLYGPDGTLRSAYNGRCLDADLNTTWRNGRVVQLWDCNSQPQQRWYGRFMEHIID